LDGRIATVSGDSKWITDAAARREVHELRAGHDAVMVGRGTAEADDPRLSVRLSWPEEPEESEESKGDPKPGPIEDMEHAGNVGIPTSSAGHSQVGVRQPRPVVVDSAARISTESRLVRDRGEELIVVAAALPAEGRTPSLSSRAKRIAGLRDRGVTVLEVPADGTGRVDLQAALRRLGEEGIQSLMVEGGAELVGALLRHGLFDVLRVYVAPILIGGDGAGLGPLGVGRVADALRLEAVRQEAREQHMLVSGFRAGWYRETRRTVTSEAVGRNAHLQEDADVHRAG
jgi:diaminohydroxyphosphoribosylaminopyrimidine deaminase/5-amino-6-(5-phosphoribosylamino)uracil reductase